ncbi:3'-5' exonuclease [Pseudomethylobacillus aquaticus]|uniref:3'-5' exonuclease n=1 Tax=Pseudomethylobacillus aquaticus TaxID=2676064 RepID=A0A3N0V6G5_9PROT|nr:3'-5' exonuclease [Pseudomethylobacillus aquaticus]ROH88397.1 3'-5' exonuclease [Pseudomethylobacillus aquaticus]
MTPTLIFDIETIPDTDGLRVLLDLPADTSAEDVANIAFHQRRQSHGHDFLPLQQHRVVAISCALREGDNFRVWTLGTPDAPEAEIIQRFFDGIEKYTPNLVSWNGGGFDLPVLHYRSLIHGVVAPRYWDMGDDDRDFKWNNYISRYHNRHLDLMDLLALYQGRANAPLDQIAQLCGFPGKLGMDGSKVWDAYKNGQIDAIRNYCETDVANTYLVYLRFQLMRGALTAETYASEIQLVRDTLGGYGGEHWQEFLQAWK